MSDYTPISCALHSEYELAIMRRTTMVLQWRDRSGEIVTGEILPTDLNTRPDGEYLTATTAEGRSIRIRLDQIMEPNR